MKRNIVAAVVGLGLAAAVVPRPANAACSTGAFNICASVTASTYSFGGTNHLVLTVVNLFPSQGQSHVLMAAGVNAVGVTSGALVGAWFTNLGVGTGLNVFGNGSGKWKDSPSNVSNAVGASVDDALGSTGSGGLIGCSELPHDNGLYATCPGGNAMVLDFSIGSQVVNLGAGYQFGWHSGTVNGQADCSLWVASDRTTVGDQSASCSSVVPEPVTIMLLGTGLTSIGGFGLLRRRKRNHDVEST
jgi:hypothetical protein